MPRIREYKKKYLINDLNHFIKDKSKEKGMSQREVAFLMGISQQVLSYKLNNNAFTYKDFLSIMEIFKPSEEEVMRLVKSWE